MAYNKLQAENDKTIAALKSIIEERDKERASENKREKEYGIIDKDIRDFCKSILSKRDMNSGKDPADILKDSLIYDSMDTKKLIAETKKAREEYDEGRISLMRQLHNENSSLKKEKNNLEEHYRINKEALSEDAQERKTLRQNIAKLQKKVSSLNTKLVEVSTIELTEEDKKRKTMLAQEAEAMGIKTRYNKTTLNAKEKEIAELTIEVLNNPKQGTKEEIARMLFNVIGTTGLSVKKDIINEFKSRLKNKYNDIEGKFPDTAFASPFQFLVDNKLLHTGTFTDNEGKKAYYIMSGLGNTVFYNITGVEAEEAEYSKVKANHTSVEHGYGIVNIAKIMRKYPDRFSNISMFNKGKTGVYLTTHILKENQEGDLVSKEVTIEPDIAFEEDFEQRYIEYELVSQSKALYFEKFDKYISRGVKMLIYIFPSEVKRREFIRNVLLYKEEKEKEGILYDVKFYLYTFKEFSDMCEKNEDWKPYKFSDEIAEESEEGTEDKKEDKKEEEKNNAVKEIKKRIMANKIKRTSSNIPTNIGPK